MRKYYLFLIRKDVAKVYNEKEQSLYNIFEKIRIVRKPNLQYGLSIYNQLCDTFDLNTLQDYFMNKYETPKSKRYRLLDRESGRFYIMDLNHSYLSLMTNDIIPKIFNILYYYNQNIFICDFENRDYFWLKDVYNKSKSINNKEKIPCKK